MDDLARAWWVQDLNTRSGDADDALRGLERLDNGEWRQHSEDLDEPLHIIEITDPDEDVGDPGAPQSAASRRATRHSPPGPRMAR